MTKNIVLVHGAFHTGECWYLLRPILEQQGFRVAAPTLRGQSGNPRFPLLVSLQTYADDLIRAAESLNGPCVLLGHSVAGFSISAAAEQRPELFSALIFLAAAVPRIGGSSLRDAEGAEPPQMARMKLRPSVTFSPDLADRIFYNRCAPELQAEARRRLSPQPLRPLLGTLRSTQARLGGVQKHYIECLDDRVATIEVQRSRQKNLDFASVQTLDTDHSPFYSNPQALAGAIARAANG